MTLHFIQLKLGNKNYKRQVSTEGCSYVDDFRDAIKNKFSPFLDSYADHHLTLFQPDGITEIDPGASITKLNESNVGPWTPLVVTVEEMPIPGSSKKQLKPVEVQVDAAEKPAIIIRSHQDYKHSKAVHSSRSYLTTIAVELEKLYALEKAKLNEPATFGDIIRNSCRTPQPAPKLPNLPELCRYFTDKEWTFLENLNNTVNPALHSELDVGIDGKTREVVLPIQLSHLATTCQRIAKKAKVVNEVSDLIVKNEGSR